MLPAAANLAVERQRGTPGIDVYGNQVIDWTTPSVLQIEGCWIGLSGGTPGEEIAAGRQTVVVDELWWGPPDADVDEKDRIKDLGTGVIYEVSGPVLLLRGFHGLLNHKQAKIQVIDE